jgi:hypothetical protein
MTLSSEFPCEVYFVKLGKGNRLCHDWLDCENPKCGIFFNGPPGGPRRDVSADQIRKWIRGIEAHNPKDLKKAKDRIGPRSWPQVRDFFKVNDFEQQRKRSIFVTIHPPTVYLAQPIDGPRDEFVRQDRRVELAKVVPVQVLKPATVKQVPHVLASLPSNRYLIQGTFRRVKDKGAIRSICYVTGLGCPPIESAPELLECLSPVEFETLVFLLFASHGLFVPAWRGGTMPGVDIVARNESAQSIRIDPLSWKPHEATTFQVKRERNCDHDDEHGAEWTIALTAGKGKVLDAKWILRNVYQRPDVMKWLKQDLEWLVTDAHDFEKLLGSLIS